TFDISSNGYPFDQPRVLVVSQPIPWNPHVQPGSGVVCIGEGWEAARGRMTLVELVAHVARILNCDEPDRGTAYVGWNSAAISYWRRELGCQPLNPGIRYPVLPVEITHGVSTDPAAMAFMPVVDADAGRVEDLGFAPVRSAT